MPLARPVEETSVFVLAILKAYGRERGAQRHEEHSCRITKASSILVVFNGQLFYAAREALLNAYSGFDAPLAFGIWILCLLGLFLRSHAV